MVSGSSKIEANARYGTGALSRLKSDPILYNKLGREAIKILRMSDVYVNNAIVYTIPAHNNKNVLTPKILYSILFYLSIVKLLLYSVNDKIVIKNPQVIFISVF